MLFQFKECFIRAGFGLGLIWPKQIKKLITGNCGGRVRQVVE
jgi:hypothetical protein